MTDGAGTQVDAFGPVDVVALPQPGQLQASKPTDILIS